MIVKPKVREGLCFTAHPKGCSLNVKNQIEYIKKLQKMKSPSKVLIIGSSTGYGLASRIAATYCGDAATIGVMYEKEPNDRRTGTPGWYNTKAFEDFAKDDGHYAITINGDAFSNEVKQEVIELIKRDLGKVDMVIYSLAAPRRAVEDGTTYNSVLKTISESYTEKSWNMQNNSISDKTIMPASEEEINATIKVMGGEDWIDWVSALSKADVLEDGAITIAYSYIGPELTYPIYYNGTIGMAKKNLHNYSDIINSRFTEKGIKAYISVNKAVVTQASGAIPIVPLYFAILYKVMKEKVCHESCIEQIGRLYYEKLFGETIITDEHGMIRLDDYEMRDDVQSAVLNNWNLICSENISELADIKGYWEDFYHMYGFNYDSIDYEEEVSII